MIVVSDVTKRYASTVAVDRLSFVAEPGRIFGLLGPNGAGKTTTLRMIMNIIEPDTGTIRVGDGATIDTDRLGYLPEERGLYKRVKVGDILRYFGSLKGRDRAFLDERIDYWLDRFDLVRCKERPVDELSKGMSQKVQFIASVVHDPDVVVFDEPFSGLDPVSADLLRESIAELGRRGKTIIFSTHIMEHAERICSHIMLMNAGREIAAGSLESVKDRFGSRSVILEYDGDGGFIGSLPMVAKTIAYPRYVEIELTSEGTRDELLASLVGRISIRRFEVVAPSLHKIFVDLVGVKEEQDA